MDISSVASRSVATALGGGTQISGQTAFNAPSSITPETGATGANVATQAPSPERVAQAVKQVNDTFTQNGQSLYASIERDKATGISVVKFMDKNTNEEIGQYPPKAIIAMAESIDQYQEGKGRLIHVSA